MPESTEVDVIDNSNEFPVIVNSENFPTMPVNDTLPDGNSVTQVEDNLEIFDVGPISTETENSTVTAPTDLSFLDFSSSAPQEPEKLEPEPVESGTDQLLDFLS